MEVIILTRQKQLKTCKSSTDNIQYVNQNEYILTFFALNLVHVEFLIKDSKSKVMNWVCPCMKASLSEKIQEKID